MELLDTASLISLEWLNVQLALSAAISCGVIKDKQGAWFGFSLFFFYAAAVVLDDWFKANDPEQVWRYVRWTLFDLVFLLWLYILAKLKLVSVYTLVISAGIEFVAILTLMVRMLDIAYVNIDFTTAFFGPLIWATNISYILLAFSPVLQILDIRSSKCN